MSHLSAEAISGHRIVKAFGGEAREAGKFERATQQFYRTIMKVTGVLSMLPPLMEFIGGIAFVAALVYGSQEIMAGRLTPGEFTAFIVALFMMYAPAKKLSRVNADLQQAMAASERVFEILDSHSEVQERIAAVTLPLFGRGIEFRDVQFVYGGNGERAILDGVSFSVPAGQTLAIVGRSGAGKTTLINLIPRFYDVTGGSICIDDLDLRDVTLESLRSQIGIVTQETVLFDDTVATNIAYGRKGATPGEIEAAARAAHAHEFIRRLPQGYETPVAEAGATLSGGERQRLGIARALLKEAPILILDEPTSAVDALSEQAVFDALRRVRSNHTTLVIAHRLSTIRDADRILVLQKGRVEAQGPHNALLASSALYRQMCARLSIGVSLDRPESVDELLRDSSTACTSATTGVTK